MDIMRTVATLENLEELQSFIAKSATTHFSKERIQQILLASEEALVNIISYAYDKNAPGQVCVRCSMTENNQFMIRFEDQGIEFNMLCVEAPDVAASLEERAIGGLGVFFIRQMVDNVIYQRKGGSNILTFFFELK